MSIEQLPPTDPAGGPRARGGCAGGVGSSPALPGAALLRDWADALAAPGTGLVVGEPLADAERIDRLRALEELKSAAAAAQALLAAELDASRRAQEEARQVPARERGRGVGAEVALARREAPHAGARLLGLGKALVAEMPHTLAALRTGAISEWRATLVVRETAFLSVEDRRTVDAELAGTPQALEQLAHLGHRGLVAAARRAAYRLDPRATVDRAARAVEDRHVTLRPAPDAMTYLTALLPVAQGVAVFASLSAEAARVRASGDHGASGGQSTGRPRSKGQVMADTLVERVTGQATADAVPVRVNLTLDAPTLLAAPGSTQTAEIGAPGVAGAGPIPAGIAALIIAAAPETGRWLRRLFTAPHTGELVAAESRTRCFPDAAADLIGLLHATCRTPWCDAPVAHIDHVVDHARGGPTALANTQGLCETCSYTKSLPGWRARPEGGGHGPPTVVITRTPTGHAYASHGAIPRPRAGPVARDPDDSA